MAASIPTPAARRRNRVLVWCALAFILVLGAEKRFAWPQTPFSDADTWGYLNPALSALTGGPFLHTYGRNFVYPAWVYLWLRTCGDFRALCVAQHLLGIAGGLLVWRIWQAWCQWFSQPRLPSWLVTLVGLGLVAFYLSSTMSIQFEQEIRPEAIFPFFALLALDLSLSFLHAWFVNGRPEVAASFGASLVFDAILLYQLKPSFGLTLGVALLPLLAAALAPAQTWSRRLVLPAAAAAGALLASLLLLRPEHDFAKGDEISTLFLPETLLTIHADVIRRQMASDLAAGNSTPYSTPWLNQLHDRLEQEFAIAAEPDRKPYSTLGFNPDYLLYEDSFCRFLYERMGPPRAARLCLYYYERSWLHQPGAMAAKVARQLGVFYCGLCPAFWQGRAIDRTRHYRASPQAYEYPTYAKVMHSYPPGRAYLAQCAALAEVPCVYRQGPVFSFANTWAAEGHLPLLAASLAGMTLLFALRSAPSRRELAPAGGLVLLFFAYVFGNCLTVAIVHSLDITRYSENVAGLAMVAEAAALVWCVEALLCARFRLNPELYHAEPVSE